MSRMEARSACADLRANLPSTRVYGGFSVVMFALDAFRYLMTGIVALLLALLLVLLIAELGAVIGTALEHVHENAPATGNFGGCVTGTSAQAKEVFVEGGS